VNEYALFVPHETDHLATVLTLPDEEPSALVLLVTGTGAPRSHRFQLWTRLARCLAERGFASVRMEYRGIGDSSGRLDRPSMGDRRLEQALAVAQFGMRATGTSRFGVAGNCSGGIVALGVAAADSACQSAVCILPRIVQLGKVNQAVIGARRSRLARAVRSRAKLDKLVRRSLTATRDAPSPAVKEAIGPALDHARVLFIYSERDRDPYVGKSVRMLGQLAPKLSPERRSRLELMTTTEGPLHGFESLSAQEFVIDTVSERMVATLNGHDAPAHIGVHQSRSPAAN
jgi:alpha/beta superfamily hydrolase